MEFRCSASALGVRSASGGGTMISRRIIFSLVTLVVLVCFVGEPLYGQGARGGVWGGESKTRTLLPSQSLTQTPLSLSAPPFCVQQITELPRLLQLNDQKRRAAIAFKDAIRPIFDAYKDIRPDDLAARVRANPKELETAFVDPIIDQTFDAFLQEVSQFQGELDRILANTTAPRCYPAKTKDLQMLAALMLQQGLDVRASPILTSNTRLLPRAYDNKYIVADQIPFKIVKGTIDRQRADVKSGLQELGLYLAGSGEDMIIWDDALSESGEAILRALDAKGFAAMKPEVVSNMAPLFMFTCDFSGIGQGGRSPSCAFLMNHKDLLKEAIQKDGNKWNGGEVTFWDRIHGKLVSFPVGTTGAQHCLTVNPSALAESYDADALNFGDCGMANTIYACPKSLAGNRQVYAHLCHRCSSSQGKKGGAGVDLGLGGGGSGAASFGGEGGGGRSGAASLEGGGQGIIDVFGGGAAPSIQDRAGGSSALTGNAGVENAIDRLCGMGDLPGGTSQGTIPASLGCDIAHQTDQPSCGPAPEESVTNRAPVHDGVPTGGDCRANRLASGNDTLAAQLARGLQQARTNFSGEGRTAGGGETLKKMWELKTATVPVAPTRAARWAATFNLGTGASLKVGLASSLGKGGMIILKGLVFGVVGNVLWLLMDAMEGTTQDAAADMIPTPAPDPIPITPAPDPDPAAPAKDSKTAAGAADSLRPNFGDCTYAAGELKKMNECWGKEIAEGMSAFGRGKTPLDLESGRRPMGPMERTGSDQGSAVSTIPEVCTLPGAPAVPQGGLANTCAAMTCGRASAGASGCCGMSQATFDAASQCPFCNGAPALGPNGRCLSECPVQQRTREPLPGPGPRPTSGPAGRMK